MSHIVKFGAAISIDEKEVADRYDGKRDEIVKYKQNRQLHDLVEKLIEVKGDELWTEHKSDDPRESRTDFFTELYIFTPAELKAYKDNILKNHGLL